MNFTMKKYYFSMLFILLISEGTVFALDNSLSIDEEFITKNPATGGIPKIGLTLILQKISNYKEMFKIICLLSKQLVYMIL